MFAALTLVAAAPASPLASLQYLVGTWNCTYDAGAIHMSYSSIYSFDRDGNTLRQVTSWGSGGDEELIGYDAQHQSWTAIVLDDHGAATVMRGAGSDPNHIAYRSVYPDASIAPTFDRVSDTKYTTHAMFQMSGKTINSVDTCVRAGQ
jgi:opacity protein-like surface antigen